MADTLKQKTFWGMIWVFTEKFSIQIFVFIQGIILARLLTPADFGLVAMVGIFNSLSRVLIDSGFSTALIRKKAPEDIDFSTVFNVNILISFSLCLILCFCSSLIANFYNEPILAQIVTLNSIQIFLNSFLSIYWVKMTVKLQFKKLSFMSVCSSVLTGILSIVLAYLGFGVWSLIYPGFFTILISALFYWHFLHWYPGHRFSKNVFKELFSFGSNILFSSLLSVLFDNIYSIVIGKKYSKQSLGYYSRGASFANLPSTTITGVLTSVTFPVLSKVQENAERLESVYRNLIRLSAFIVFPVMLGVASLARPFIICLVTEKWEQSVIYMQLLCFAMMLFPIHALNVNLLKVKGRSDLYLRIEIIKKILILVVLIFTIPFGIIYMCLGQVFTSFLCLFINTYYTGKLLNLKFILQMKDLLPVFLLSISMGAIVYAITSVIGPNIIKLILGIIIGISYYFGVAYILKMKELLYVKSLIVDNLLKR